MSSRASVPDASAAERTLATLGGDRCPVCGHAVRAAIDVDAFQLYACESCDSWCSDAAVRRASTSFTPHDYFANASADRDKWEGLLVRLDRPFRTALDVGCGRGEFLAFLRGRHPELRAAGIELDAERASDARAANPEADVQCGDARELLERGGDRYDLITLWDVFEHVPAPALLLRALARRLASGGQLYIQTIHEHSLVPSLGRLSYRLSAGRLRYLARRTHDAHHLVFFSRQALALLAAGAGLSIRQLWFDRLAHARMDGPAPLTLAASALLAAENALGNGLFVNLILERSGSDASGAQ